MKYILQPLDPEREPVIFDTENVVDLARLGRYDADGVIYFDGIGYHEPTAPQPSPQPSPARPTGPTLAYVRELEAEADAVKAERDALLRAGQAMRDSVLVSGSEAHWRDYYRQFGESNPLDTFDSLVAAINRGV